MSKPTYWELLKHPKWQEKRLRILDAAKWTCEECGAKDVTLHVHHSYYERGLAPWEYPASSLHSLCEKCHETVQCNMTLLQRQIGRLQLWQLEKLYGFALALESEQAGASQPIRVDSFAIAEGLAHFYSINPSAIIHELVGGAITAQALQSIGLDVAMGTYQPGTYGNGGQS